jgi:hypothetical protein
MGKRGRKLPPLSFGDLERVVKADGWVRVEGTKHENYEHPTKPGKVSSTRSGRAWSPEAGSTGQCCSRPA